MMPDYTKPSGETHKIQVESRLIYAIWTQPRAHAEQEAGLEVRTSFVGNGAKIKITCYTDNGKKLEKMEGVVLNNRFKGKMVIPAKVKPDDMIYFEAKLPKHGLSVDSNSIPVRPAIQVTSIQWDRQEVKRKETVTMTCQFTDGVMDGDDATVIIYEHNPNSCDFKVVAIPTTIKNNKVEMQWEFDYQDSVEQIPTEDELQPYQKSYANPQFYFIVLIDGIRVGENRESGLMTFKDNIDLLLNDEEGKPRSGEKYTITFADGTQQQGTLDTEGKAHIDKTVPGPIRVEYPEL